jgi:RNA polymerase sigma factor (TIGR02999 family)
MSDIASILSKVAADDPHAASELLPLVYDELRRLAAHKLAQEGPGLTLDATALVHEAYLRLVDIHQTVHWNSRGHFFGAAAEAMRRILVENARRKRRLKHGGHRKRVDFDESLSVAEDAAVDILAVSEALDLLAMEDPQKAQLVKLRYFTGLSLPEVAKMLGISRATAFRHWAYAKVWLYCAIHDNDRTKEP